MSDHATVSTDPLFIGMTRPAMALGVPFGALVVNVMVTTIAFLAANDLRAFALALPIHAIAYLLTLRDPRIFDLLFVRVMRTPPVPNTRFFGAKSYTP